MASETVRAGCQLPEDLVSILDSLGKAETDARQVVESLTDTQLTWQASVGKTWSIAQCLDHFAKTNTFYTDAMRCAVRKTPPDTNAPKKVIPAGFGTGEEVLVEFYASHQEMRSLIAECGNVDLNRVRFKSPFFWAARFTVGTGLLIIAAHERRHLWQAKQVRSLIEALAT